MANLYFGELGRLAEVAPKPGQCCTPAAQLELLTLGPAQLWGAEQTIPCTKGPLGAICSTPENLYLLLPTPQPLISMPAQFNQLCKLQCATTRPL